MKVLEQVDFFDSQKGAIDGLLSVRETEPTASVDEQAALLQAAAFEHVDYVFFRRYYHSYDEALRTSDVAAYVIDNSNESLSEEDVAKLHHVLWLHGVAPLVYVAWPTRIDILSCARAPDFWRNGETRYSSADRIEFQDNLNTAVGVSKAIAKRKQYSAYRLADGTFWDDPANRDLAKDDAAAHKSLIQAIVEADRDIKGGEYPVRRRLLVLMILIKYLEDRHVFPSSLFGKFLKHARSFRDVLRFGTVDDVERLLRYFERRFNGDVFTLGDGESLLEESDLRVFARLVEANVLGGQRYFWELYSFRHIPVEVISRLYQRFVTGHGAVYTPPVLASLLLDQVLPFDRITGNEKILDPACGSGIFLVGAFQRLVVHWRSKNNWAKPSVEDLREILSKSIFGVELESAAVDLTAFSLALAVCDALEPPIIWNSLKLDQLRGRNLREGDFFDPATTKSTAREIEWPDQFDIIVGNPPFESQLTEFAAIENSKLLKQRVRLPDSQSAYLFLEFALRKLRRGGEVCLVQPHGVLYNSKAMAFRQHLLTLGRLRAVLDFVSLRGLYESKDPKTVAWHAIRDDSRLEPVSHFSFRRTYAASQRLSFEMDHYDWNLVSQSEAFHNPSAWKIGLLGGGRLNDVACRFRKYRTLAQLVEKNGWTYGEGFNVGNKKNKAKFLTGKPHLPTDALESDGIDEWKIQDSLDIKKFEAPRSKELYEPPLILIKENWSLPIAFWNASFLSYRHSIVGIKSPPSQIRQLKRLFNQLNRQRDLYRFLILLNSGRVLAGRATAINKEDIDALPVPPNSKDLELAFWESVLLNDVLDYMADYVRLGQESTLLTARASSCDVENYSSLFVRMLRSVYSELKSAPPRFLNGLIAQVFYFGKEPDVDWLDDDSADALEDLVYDESKVALRTVRVVRYYERNVILIVKPDRLRYWIGSTAIRDADDTLIDLQRQGL